ncbi:3225_t:CDS:10 [Paraglomus occultum]|uniref:3225_t:CDS:1 n=1 Tax=Paraglomus occultum TaxID=144539 RepID=A0A9N8ZHI0_9GLOM|nr:3225_t:CDS:10 [Paraglomus occultum]
MIQWRPVIMLAAGIAFMLITALLQDPQNKSPKMIKCTQEIIFTDSAPDGIFLVVLDDWVYLTAIWKEHEEAKTRELKGLIKQYRRPLQSVISLRHPSANASKSWQLLYVHQLDGPIAHLSKYCHANVTIHSAAANVAEYDSIAILYYTQKDEDLIYTVRLYRIGVFRKADQAAVGECKSHTNSPCHSTPSFRFQDIILPGTMPIKAFYVDNNMILYSRQVGLHFDKYKFRMIKMPNDILNDDENDDRKIESSDPGVLQRLSQMDLMNKTSTTLRTLHISTPGAIRVLYAEATGNERAWSYSVVTYDNASTTNTKWRRKSIIYEDHQRSEEIDDMDIHTQVTQLDRPMLHPIVATAQNATTIAIPLSDSLKSYDFILHLKPEQYRVREIRTSLHGDRNPFFVGAEINAAANQMALVTKDNYIPIFKRGIAEVGSGSPQKRPLNLESDEQAAYVKNTSNNLDGGEAWHKRMTLKVTFPSYEEFDNLYGGDVIAVKLFNNSSYADVEEGTTGNFLFVVYGYGILVSFDLGIPYQESFIWYFVTEKWQMCITMLFVVLLFSWHEMQ